MLEGNAYLCHAALYPYWSGIGGLWIVHGLSYQHVASSISVACAVSLGLWFKSYLLFYQLFCLI